MAAIRTGFGPLLAACNTTGKAAASPRSAKARVNRAWRSGGSLPNSSTSAWVTSRPGNSRAVVKPMARNAGSADCNCSTNSGTPADWRARIAPRVASTMRGLGTSALRTRSYSFAASAGWPAASSRSAHRMQPSATAERTAAGAAASDCSSVCVAAASPIRPRATAAAEATSASASFSCCANPSTALASRRTPIELITPTSKRPFSLPIAWRNASSAAGPGITSNAIRAQDASCSSASSGASAGTASAVPWTASRLQVIALSAAGASDWSTLISWRCWSSAAFASSAARAGRASMTLAATTSVK